MEVGKPSFDELFENVITYPDFEYQERLNMLVGLDNQKSRLVKIISLLINPYGIEKWAEKHHKGSKKAFNYVLKRPPLIVLEGDVGSGKSELATTISDAVARQEKIDIQLLPLSLSTRGQGRVGEMTRLISAAFDYTIERAEKLKNKAGSSRGAVVLLVDEADALTQSRESAQMHHEDRAGVNAFIRGIDRVANGKIPAAIIMCTNRINALDPAVKRRSADIISFGRPTEEQRSLVLKEPLKELGFLEEQILEIVKETGPNNKDKEGFTFSDLTQRLIPSIILNAYPDNPVEFESAIRLVKQMIPTPPFNDKKYVK
ncbi:MAG: AAA family ATPase [Chlorobaculum sp.]|nr:AAA family ATPase [Chlorobaculum sp.]